MKPRNTWRAEKVWDDQDLLSLGWVGAVVLTSLALCMAAWVVMSDLPPSLRLAFVLFNGVSPAIAGWAFLQGRDRRRSR